MSPKKIVNKKFYNKFFDTPQNSAFTLAVATIILVLIMIFGAIRPAITSIVNEMQNNDERRRLIELQEKKRNNLESLLAQEREYAEQIGILNEIQPQFDDSEFVVRNINDYIKGNPNIVIQDYVINYQSRTRSSISSAAPSLRTLTLSLTFSSDIDNAIEFIEFLESFPRIFDIQDGRFFFAEEEFQNSNLPLTGQIELLYSWTHKEENT